VTKQNLMVRCETLFGASKIMLGERYLGGLELSDFYWVVEGLLFQSPDLGTTL
jgi:hypothetical protein